MTRAMFLTARRVLRHPVLWLLIWSYRDVIALWWRSLAGELRRSRRLDPDRLRKLVAALWSATRGTRFAVRTRLDEVQLVSPDDINVLAGAFERTGDGVPIDR